MAADLGLRLHVVEQARGTGDTRPSSVPDDGHAGRRSLRADVAVRGLDRRVAYVSDAASASRRPLVFKARRPRSRCARSTCWT
jgi:hypothetical protein